MDKNFSAMDLQDCLETLPEEMKEELFTYLEYNEVLRLRRVSRRFLVLAESHLAERPKRSYAEIKMNSLDNSNSNQYAVSLYDLRKMRISDNFLVPNIAFIFNPDSENTDTWEEFLQNPDIDWFMKSYAPFVKQLSLQSLYLPIPCTVEVKFLESFTNLEELEINNLALLDPQIWENNLHLTDPKFFLVFVPESFKNIKRLSVGTVRIHDPDKAPLREELNLFWKFVDKLCETSCLQEFQIPDIASYQYTVDDLRLQLNSVTRMIESGLKAKKPMKMFEIGPICDIINSDTDLDFEIVRDFFQLCVKAKIKFEDCEDLRMLATLKDLYADRVWSMFCNDPNSLLLYNFPILTKVDFSHLEHYRLTIDKSSNIRCPNLEGIRVAFAAEQGQEGYQHEKQLAQLLFGRSCRSKLKSLSIKYTGDTGIPLEAFQLAKSCTNLTYLCIQNCSAWNSFFLELWRGLPLLEYIKLCGCPSLGDIGLIGTNPEDPIICQLKRLKYLELTDLSRMTGITDETLKVAVGNIKLRCLRLSSDKWKRTEFENLEVSHYERIRSPPSAYIESPTEISTISLDGIRALQKGAFAKTIENLFFDALSIAGVSREELDAVKNGFRSVQF